VDGGIDLDVDVVPNLVVAHVGGERNVPMVSETTGEHMPRPLAETCTGRHLAAALQKKGERGDG
jgi:hypothetical protein